MRGPIKNLYNSKLLYSNGGMVYCSECGCITGKIERMNYSYIKYFFVCKCGSVGKAELYRGKRPWLTYPKRPLYNKDNQFICQNCERPLFWVKEDTVDNFAFAVICSCGVEYDMKFVNKRENIVEKI